MIWLGRSGVHAPGMRSPDQVPLADTYAIIIIAVAAYTCLSIIKAVAAIVNADGLIGHRDSTILSMHFAMCGETDCELHQVSR